MNNNTCFVIMPIGTQTVGDITITKEKLKEKYDYIIKNAILQANPNLSVIRADEELNPSSMSNDIFMKLMYSEYVVADITYPNPNVFYELGIRHAIMPKTILIREKLNVSVPFDISHLRYIEYTLEPSGMPNLSQELKKRFEFYNNNPEKPDNQFLELCSFINYTPNVYKRTSSESDTKAEILHSLISFLFKNPALLNAILDKNTDSKEKQKALISELSKTPEDASQLLTSMFKAGIIKF